MKTITEEQYKSISERLDIEVELIKAVQSVETNGLGYHENNLLKILFEAHIFHRLTNGIYSKNNLDISSLKWNRSLYIGGIKEYNRLNKAYELNLEAALQSASWGLFQIMGFNYKACGYLSIYSFINDVKKGLYQALQQFLQYCKTRNILNLLKEYKWAEFAKAYNGLSYKKNRYDTKLKSAYFKYKNINLNLVK